LKYRFFKKNEQDELNNKEKYLNEKVIKKTVYTKFNCVFSLLSSVLFHIDELHWFRIMLVSSESPKCNDFMTSFHCNFSL
jgi:hypothetical protein